MITHKVFNCVCVVKSALYFHPFNYICVNYIDAIKEMATAQAKTVRRQSINPPNELGSSKLPAAAERPKTSLVRRPVTAATFAEPPKHNYSERELPRMNPDAIKETLLSMSIRSGPVLRRAAHSSSAPWTSDPSSY
jgi:hypothetical protein